MYRRIIAKASVEVKRLVEEKFKAYTETFKTEVATSPAEDTAADAFRLRSKRFLFSYSWQCECKSVINFCSGHGYVWVLCDTATVIQNVYSLNVVIEILLLRHRFCLNVKVS